MKSFIFHIKNQMNQREFKICFGILCLISFGGVVLNCTKYYHHSYMNIRSAADSFLLVSTSARAVTMIFSLIFPLIAATLCSGCRRNSEKKGVGLFSMMRMNRKEYVMGNAVSVIVLTITSILLVLMMNQLLCLITFPVVGYNNRFGTPEYVLPLEYDENLLFDFWQVQNPYIYNLIYAVVISIFGGGIALLTYGIQLFSFTEKLKPIQISILIFLFFICLTLLGQLMNIPVICYLSYVETAHYIGFTSYVVFIAMIYGLGIGLSIIGMKKYECI